MAIVEIPIAEDSAFWRQRTSLDGVDYWLDFAYNQRADCWYLSIFTVDDVAIVRSIKLVSNRPLLRRYRHLDVPPGEIMAIDTTRAVAAAGYRQLGKTVKLLYVEASELPSG